MQFTWSATFSFPVQHHRVTRTMMGSRIVNRYCRVSGFVRCSELYWEPDYLTGSYLKIPPLRVGYRLLFWHLAESVVMSQKDMNYRLVSWEEFSRALPGVNNIDSWFLRNKSRCAHSRPRISVMFPVQSLLPNLKLTMSPTLFPISNLATGAAIVTISGSRSSSNSAGPIRL